MKEEASQVDDLRQYPIHRWRGPPSPMGKATKREHRYPHTQPSPRGNAIKLSGRTFLAPHRGSSPKGLCKRTGFSRRYAPKNPVRLHILPSALPPKGEARRYVANDFLNLIALPQGGRQQNEDTAFLDTMPFPMEKGKRRRLRRPKRKPTPPRCARQPLPREGPLKKSK